MCWFRQGARETPPGPLWQMRGDTAGAAAEGAQETPSRGPHPIPVCEEDHDLGRAEAGGRWREALSRAPGRVIGQAPVGVILRGPEFTKTPSSPRCGAPAGGSGRGPRTRRPHRSLGRLRASRNRAQGTPVAHGSRLLLIHCEHTSACWSSDPHTARPFQLPKASAAAHQSSSAVDADTRGVSWHSSRTRRRRALPALSSLAFSASPPYGLVRIPWHEKTEREQRVPIGDSACLRR